MYTTVENTADLQIPGWKKLWDVQKDDMFDADGRRLKLGDTHPHTIESLDNLIDLYEAWNTPEKAQEWLAKLTQIEDFVSNRTLSKSLLSRARERHN